jgi:hypothetical protein
MTDQQPTPPVLPGGAKPGRPNRLRIFLILAIAAILLFSAWGWTINKALEGGFG